jgi:two-component system sensor histidine kinase BaeS
VAVNLISNAIKYTDDEGYFKILITGRKDHVEIFFINSGEGIPKEDRPYIFERFYRVDKSRTRETGNAGIGLSIVKEIILSHNGYIEVEGENDFETVFKIVLPYSVGIKLP